MDPELLSVIQIAVRSALIFQVAMLAMETWLVYLLCGLTGRLREMVYVLSLRIILLNGMGIVGLHYLGERVWYQLLYAGTIVFLNLLITFVTWRNFEGDMVRIFAAIFIADMLVGGLGTVASVPVNILAGRENIYVMNAAEPMLPYDLLIPVFFLMFSFLTIRLLRPLIAVFHRSRWKYRRLLWIGFWVVFLLSVFSSLNVFTNRLYWVTIGGFLFIIWAFAALFWEYRQNILRKRDYYQKQLRFISRDIQQMQEQFVQMEDAMRYSQEKLRSFRELSEDTRQPVLSDYMKQMKETYRLLRPSYAKSPLLNAALSYGETLCRNMGIRPEFSVGELDLGGVDEDHLVRVILQILESGIRGAHGERGVGDVEASRDVAEHGPRLALSINDAKGMILISAFWHGKCGRSAVRAIREVIGKECGTVDRKVKGGEAEVLVYIYGSIQLN